MLSGVRLSLLQGWAMDWSSQSHPPDDPLSLELNVSPDIAAIEPTSALAASEGADPFDDGDFGRFARPR